MREISLGAFSIYPSIHPTSTIQGWTSYARNHLWCHCSSGAPRVNLCNQHGVCVGMGTWKAKCPMFKAMVAGFRGKVALKNRTLGVPCNL